MSSINLSQFEGIDSDHYENFPIYMTVKFHRFF